MRKLLMFSSVLAALSSGAYAVTDVPEKPQAIGKTIHANTPYSSATLSKLGFTIYDAALWTDAPQWSMNAPFALTLHYHMSFKSQKIIDRTLDEMKHVDDLPDATLARYGKLLGPLFPDVKDGDTITALYTPGGKTAFYHNGDYTGAVSNPAFAKPFFDIWLSPRSSEPDMQKKLTSAPPRS